MVAGEGTRCGGSPKRGAQLGSAPVSARAWLLFAVWHARLDCFAAVNLRYARALHSRAGALPRARVAALLCRQLVFSNAAACAPSRSVVRCIHYRSLHDLSFATRHGLGDSYNSAAMERFMDEVRDVHKDIVRAPSRVSSPRRPSQHRSQFIHSIYIDPMTDADQKAGWFGDLHAQMALVAVQLAAVPELADGFDALGFSQGGQFLRAYVEWYNTPRVHSPFPGVGRSRADIGLSQTSSHSARNTSVSATSPAASPETSSATSHTTRRKRAYTRPGRSITSFSASTTATSAGLRPI